MRVPTINRKTFKDYITNTSGATTIEYALTATVISLAAIKSIHCIGEYCIKPMFSGMSESIENIGANTDTSSGPETVKKDH